MLEKVYNLLEFFKELYDFWNDLWYYIPNSNQAFFIWLEWLGQKEVEPNPNLNLFIGLDNQFRQTW